MMNQTIRIPELKELIAPVLAWYRKNARTLPWRSDPTPYHVWVSEIMLQQTRVEAVLPYYKRFLNALPDVADLAACEEEKLMKLWEGLGYYNRVRNMQSAAQTVMAEYQGRLPADYDRLLELKGIGSYTAGAIASISYGLLYPAVDGNVLRILMRVRGDDSDITRQAVKRRVEEELKEAMQEVFVKQQGYQEKICSKNNRQTDNLPGAFNQAMMDLGALICLPNGQPLCEKCPWECFCVAKAKDRVNELPVKSRAKKRRIEDRTVLLISDGNEFVIRKRPLRGLLAGMYEFPNVSGTLSAREALLQVKKMHLNPLHITKLENAKHVFSHVEWHMTGYEIYVDPLDRKSTDLLFADWKTCERTYAIPSAFSVYKEYAKRLCQD